MAIIAVLNTKGGVGKTTIAINIATARALGGSDVLAVDGDRQGSLIQAMAQREGVQQIAVAHYSDGQILRQQVTIARDKYTDIVIDAGGRDNTALRAALLLADIVLIPFQPRSLDVWALDDMRALLAEARASRDIHAYAFLAMADSRGQDNAEAVDSCPEGIEYLAASIGRRKSIADAVGRGRGILEEASKDKKAAAEMGFLHNIICEKLAVNFTER
jgi:chromosome partitioning protein